ncbi:hypothetical protein [Agrobacterium pusense]|uniref:hypothetical protein n=1 Tax=Agrobacterium pusense TaxID=648995 RepID=UPI0005C89EFF|nr:hypothetical protein [Agrobacterium pusense]UXT89287.1 hypothetical protein FY130_05825 [Agrobacterium pusense]
MNKTNNPEMPYFIERAIENDRKKLTIIKDEATEIVASATPNDNPAASLAEAAIEEVEAAQEHYKTALENAHDQTIAADSFKRAYPHLVKAEQHLAEARAALIDPIYPKRDQLP